MATVFWVTTLIVFAAIQFWFWLFASLNARGYGYAKWFDLRDAVIISIIAGITAAIFGFAAVGVAALLI